MKYFNLLFLIFTLFILSCSQSRSEKYEEAIDAAHFLLTKSKCQQSISLLESIGVNSLNAEYLQLLAASYACKSDFRTINFFADDLDKINGSSGAFFGSLSKLSTSPMDSPADSNFVNLQKAIDILLYAGGVDEPTSEQRAEIFESIDANNINMQNLYMLIVQLGKYLYYYGNADPVNGVKGTGSIANGNTNNLTNGCFYDYNPSDATVAAAINLARANGQAGSCNSTASGHERLVALPNSNTVKRMCQGIILFNSLLNIITNLDIPVKGKALAEVGDVFRTVCTQVPGISDLCALYNQEQCEADFANAPASDKLQIYFFFIFEKQFT
jgi:hypothetical protein